MCWNITQKERERERARNIPETVQEARNEHHHPTGVMETERKKEEMKSYMRTNIF